MTEKLIRWADAPTEDDVSDAKVFLALLGGDGRGPEPEVHLHPAKDLLRAARLPALPRNNEGVAKWSKRIKNGDEVPPVLLVRGNLATDQPLIIAEGYHRVSAAYLLDEQTPVAGRFLTLD